MVVVCCVCKKFRPNGKRRDVKDPHIFKGRLYTKKNFTANEGLVGVSCAVEGKKGEDGSPNFFPNGRGKDKEKGNVRDERQ